MSGAEPGGASVRERLAKQALWDAFCAARGIAETGVVLFTTDPDGTVEVFGYGRDSRSMLRRSTAMQELLAGTIERVLGSVPGEAEGTLYLMYRLDAAGRVSRAGEQKALLLRPSAAKPYTPDLSHAFLG